MDKMWARSTSEEEICFNLLLSVPSDGFPLYCLKDAIWILVKNDYRLGAYLVVLSVFDKVLKQQTGEVCGRG